MSAGSTPTGPRWAKLNEEALQEDTDRFPRRQGGAAESGVRTDLRQGHNAKLADAIEQADRPRRRQREVRAEPEATGPAHITRERITFVLELTRKSAQRGRADREAQGAVSRIASRRSSGSWPPTTAIGRSRAGSTTRRTCSRMLKGAGILEFRILPTTDRPELSAAEIQRYLENLVVEGPQGRLGQPVHLGGDRKHRGVARS